jgi:hypothetical protein
MTVEYIRYTIPAARQEAFIASMKAACAILDMDQDCRDYELANCEEDATLFIWRIHWTSVDRHLNGFRKSEAFGPFYQLVKSFIPDISEMHHYAPLIRKAKSSQE